eukprot:CAMPEP_0171993216 /NCGR_PEP_ID=MMETSP0993-20121228/278334_1 /TAXON_ID=483369 /ORGANISM="non described non described, Strain CCMP2098" /LENGTH=56 /DNA_ID=CAMNT_0012646273 /DNA_START=1023 /DNA_END=1193 /DNA_ORIENTATION=-
MSFNQHYLAGAPCQMLTIVLWSMNNNAGWWGMRVQTHESSHSTKTGRDARHGGEEK